MQKSRESQSWNWRWDWLESIVRILMQLEEMHEVLRRYREKEKDWEEGGNGISAKEPAGDVETGNSLSDAALFYDQQISDLKAVVRS